MTSKTLVKFKIADDYIEDPDTESDGMPSYAEDTPLVPDRYGQRFKIFDDVVRPVCAELVATMLFVFIGVCAIYSNGSNLSGIAMAHGFTIALLVMTFGGISGAHINPAVTLGAFIAGAISWPMAICYFAAQITGGICGAALAYGCLGFMVSQDMTAFVSINGGGQMLGEGVSVWQGFLCETALTFLLVTVVLTAAVDSDGANVLAPLAIGFAVTVDILAGGPISGASMNPARTFGPAVIASGSVNLWTNQWIYWAGPALGAVLASTIYKFLFIRPDKRSFMKNE